jgi:hypothetical protein
LGVRIVCLCAGLVKQLERLGYNVTIAPAA